MAPGNSARLGDVPPVYRIDLSLPPSQRYVELAEIYREQLRSLTGLFDDFVQSIDPRISLTWTKRIARLFLRKLYTTEETEEIKGISSATGIELYLLVSLNVLLDLLMGCTSGAATSQELNEDRTKMLHFRTLDWGMDGLRRLTVQLEFVRGPETDKVLATSITYVGFVGVLTGVRKDLSVSLNFRPNHDMSGFAANYRFYTSHLLVLLGVRQSISSLVRQYIVPVEPSKGLFGRVFKRDSQKEQQDRVASLRKISLTLPQTPTTAAYLIFCDGKESLVLEKDHRSAVTSSSSSFIVATNSDLETTSPSYQLPEPDQGGVGVAAEGAITMTDLIVNSNDRRAKMQSFWDAKVKSSRRSQGHRQRSSRRSSHKDSQRKLRPPTHSSKSHRDEDGNGRACTSGLETYELLPQSEHAGSTSPAPASEEITATQREVVRWITAFPITNEMTHFSTVMDPSEGRIAWVRRYTRPLEFESD